MTERTPGTSEGARRAPRAVRQAQILDAALECFARQGYHGTTMDDLVRATGLSKGSLYWHFASKEEVLIALFDRMSEQFLAAWSPSAHQGEDPVEVIRAAIQALVGEFLAERALSQAWLEFFGHPVARARMAEIYVRSRTLIAELLTRAQATRTLAPHAPEAMASVFTAVGEGLLLQAIVDPDFDAAQAVDVALDALIRGFTR